MNRYNKGELHALDELVSLVYEELINKAHYIMQGERSGHMLQASALVHEAYLRLIELVLLCQIILFRKHPTVGGAFS